MSSEIKAPESWKNVAVALGAIGVKVSNYEDLKDQVGEFLTCEGGPAVLEAVVDRTNYLYPGRFLKHQVHGFEECD